MTSIILMSIKSALKKFQFVHHINIFSQEVLRLNIQLKKKHIK